MLSICDRYSGKWGILIAEDLSLLTLPLRDTDSVTTFACPCQVFENIDPADLRMVPSLPSPGLSSERLMAPPKGEAASRRGDLAFRPAHMQAPSSTSAVRSLQAVASILALGPGPRLPMDAVDPPSRLIYPRNKPTAGMEPATSCSPAGLKTFGAASVHVCL